MVASAQSLSETRSIGWRVAYLVAAAAAYLLDQASKAWAAKTLRWPQGDAVKVIDGLLSFEYAENTGIAFGQLQNGGGLGRWFLSGLAAAAAAAVLFYFFRTPRNEDRVLGACALLLAGITGNLTDRLRLGYVIDFISFYYQSWHWPVFNVADACICVGAFLLAIDAIFGGQKAEASGRQESPLTTDH
jgi:signal peptidase II